ncbi:MAG: 2-dehydro-3-deoxygalactonokinase [Burkholderiales bacterium]|nr:2-dehydro-3-deoxygalactonokinase [Burkholderiales bacterium]
MIAIDWGTTGFRAFRLDAAGHVVERREAALGILAVHDQRFAEALESQVGDWLNLGVAPVLMSGMVGSRQGWREAAYLPCPVGASDVGAHLTEVQWGSPTRVGWIVPGLITRDASGIHDVLRGEETQILGIAADLGPGEHAVCLPGTHSKWITLRDGRIITFRTFMTGELFAVLRDHSILGRTMRHGADDFTAFDAGVQRASAPGGLPHHLFGIRAESLAGRLDPEAAAQYLSGLLIGHELREAVRSTTAVHLLGAPALVDRYARALRTRGIAVEILDPDAAVRGLFHIARSRSGAR